MTIRNSNRHITTTMTRHQWRSNARRRRVLDDQARRALPLASGTVKAFRAGSPRGTVQPLTSETLETPGSIGRLPARGGTSLQGGASALSVSWREQRWRPFIRVRRLGRGCQSKKTVERLQARGRIPTATRACLDVHVAMGSSGSKRDHEVEQSLDYRGTHVLARIGPLRAPTGSAKSVARTSLVTGAYNRRCYVTD